MSHYETNPETQLRSIEFIFGKPFYVKFLRILFFSLSGLPNEKRNRKPYKTYTLPIAYSCG